MTELDALADRVTALEKRNQRVEADKAWETSKTRRVSVAILTYAVIGVYLQVVVHISPWINAVVPTVAFLISTLALQAGKSAWIKHLRRGG